MELFVLHYLKLYTWDVSPLCGQTFSGWLFFMPHALLQACWHCKVWADLADWLVWDDTVRISVEWLLYVLGSGAWTTSSLMKWNVVKKTECTWVSWLWNSDPLVCSENRLNSRYQLVASCSKGCNTSPAGVGDCWLPGGFREHRLGQTPFVSRNGRVIFHP